MKFLAPLFFWSFLSFLPLVAIYFLKVRPRRRTATAYFLWNRVFTEKKATSLFQRLRDLLSLLLMSLVFGSVCLALTRPELVNDDRKDLLILIDNSASMSAGSGSAQRLALAKTAASDLIKGMDASQRASVASVASDVSFLSHLTDNPRQLLDAVTSVNPTSLDFNRDAIAERVMDGFALPAHQLVPAGITGHAAALPKLPFDVQGARRLLADAGYPDGFGLTLNGPNDRYLNDAKTLEAMGQMLSRIGLQVKIVSEPWNVYFPKARVTANLEGLPYSAMLVGWGHSVGDTSGMLTTVLHSFDTQRRFGSGNRSGYNNAAFDQAIQDAVAEMEPAARSRKLEAVMATATHDLTTIPIYNNFVVMAARAGFAVTPRMDDEVLAMSVQPSR
jgi:hypothetical protein